jgi:hypothetical protein
VRFEWTGGQAIANSESMTNLFTRAPLGVTAIHLLQNPDSGHRSDHHFIPRSSPQGTTLQPDAR